jgi:hypothetical protein
VTKAGSNDKLTVTITDVLGRVVEKSTNVPANGTVQVGANLRPGIYFLEARQGDDRKLLKLMKD